LLLRSALSCCSKLWYPWFVLIFHSEFKIIYAPRNEIWEVMIIVIDGPTSTQDASASPNPFF
jgi:hypothetical protein